MKSENEKKKNETLLVPPFECVENGCKERSKKCHDCRYGSCTWFRVPVNKMQEQ